jgi:hypothetical protein
VDGAAADPTGIANLNKGAGTSLEHVCKVFGGCNQASIPIYVRLADDAWS